MSAIQNFKNFIRHGKQARAANAHSDPITDISPVNAHQQRNRYAPAAQQNPGITEPNMGDLVQAPPVPQDGYSAANIDNRNVVAHAEGVAAKNAEAGQRLGGGEGHTTGKNYDPSVIERIVAEERESKGKLPRYPGLDRYILVEKMGDGAFSNVYRAKDTATEMREVAIKVVRKFEMNSSQVSCCQAPKANFLYILHRNFCLLQAACPSHRVLSKLCFNLEYFTNKIVIT